MTCSSGNLDHGEGGVGRGRGVCDRGGGLRLEENGADWFSGKNILLRVRTGVHPGVLEKGREMLCTKMPESKPG